jgi:hypothetical protein
MKTALSLTFMLALFMAGPAASDGAPLKPRLVVLTDIAPDNAEPDDMESTIRLLVHADLFEIEGLVHSTGYNTTTAKESYYQLIHEAIGLYEKDLPNLMRRSKQEGHLDDEEHQEIGYWPSPKYLRERAVMGSMKRGQEFIGEENDSDGSNLIIKLADEADDDRPIWVTVWGGGNTLAQACWQVKKEKSPEELKAFLRKIRTYTITDQDRAMKSDGPNWRESSHLWLRKEFEGDLFFIWDESAWKFQNAAGKSRWDEYQANIQGHGNLGGRYPKYKYGVEGDTPSFLYLMPIGLSNPEVPNQGGWGGFFEFGECQDKETRAFQNHAGPEKKVSEKYQQYFYPAIFNNFAARMDWAKDGNGNRNPIVVIDGDAGRDILTRQPAKGTTVALDASGTHDPDGDALTFKWWVLPEAGTYAGTIAIANGDTSKATISVPADSAGKSFHVICEVTDNGAPNLTGYRRIIFEPTD